MGKVVLVALVAAVLYGMFSYMALSYAKAMEQCQAKGYSFDTCFHSLNR